ncbi:DNA polymerase III subunit psi [Veronia pacifica]|uniref:DNA polymerase III subunit psi n=1 Tax=Veronia pacifica TaxID=1080227 RepID=A0A1C3EK48_9GAMM|nr:DNA polymerase III subunit psi [Veronia pacifica]ODA33608.1 DNA polymerase III subunit psi [Veronia pacifica]
MALDDIQRLSEMGITSWQLRRPDLYPDHAKNTVTIPASCKLLLICDVTLDDHDAWLFSKILSSMKLSPEQTMMLSHQAVQHINQHHLEWVWYIGAPNNQLSGTKSLISVPLSEMHDDPSAKKALWLQICKYEN